jgi:hypothetical protein
MTETSTSAAIAGARPDSALAAISVDMDAPADVRTQVVELLEPFVHTRPAEQAGAQWQVIATWGTDTDGLVSYGGHDDTAVKLGVDVENRLIRLVAEPGSRYLAVHTSRMVRSLLRLGAAQADPGALFLHGGMFARDGFGFAVLGRKRSGKTSVILSMLASGHDFVSNDDLSIHLAERPNGIGWPRSVSIRQDTLRALGKSGVSGDHPANSHFDTYGDQAQLLFPRQVAELFDAPLVPSATVAGLIFPRFVDDPDDTGIVELTRAQAEEQLLANVLDPPVKDEFLAEHFIRPAPTVAAAVAGALPAFDVRHNLTIIARTADELAALLDKQR